jgi:HisA/HisF family protein
MLGMKPSMTIASTPKVAQTGMMQDFAVIPVIDLKGGSVVHARAGMRTQYRPIASPFGLADDPVAIARALLEITGSPTLYVADLDAIAGTGDHFDICRDLAHALPHTALWIDAGFADVTACLFWLPLGATLVVGSEGLSSVEAWSELSDALGGSVILSLDFAPEGFRGPASLAVEPSLWSDRVIAMSLGRVGTNTGFDLERLEGILGQAGDRAVFAAGGMRDIGDLEAIALSGAGGALIATALHETAIRQNEIAAFLRKRRSRSRS